MTQAASIACLLPNSAYNVYDGSGLLQLNADYYLSDTWTVGALAMTNFGRRRSDFGSLQQGANFLVKVARYLP